MLALSLRGLEMSMRVVVYVTVAAIAVLLFYFVVAIPHVDFTRNALNIATDPAGSVLHLPEGNGPGLPFGITGIMLSLPFGVYMFLAVEQLPLTAEEAKNPKCDMPRALILSVVTLIILALGVLFFSASIPEGAYAMVRSGEPLLDGFRTNFGDGDGPNSWPQSLFLVLQQAFLRVLLLPGETSIHSRALAVCRQPFR
ncbi:amino acid permease [Brucella tritici]|uniref:amino acid permease n=1 Tax=Brucella tritici TaxID=94626 RepID=UPI0022A65C23|nr:amino acid permease [Brucella tritici]